MNKLSKKQKYDIEAIIAAFSWIAIVFCSAEFIGGVPALIIILLFTGIILLIDRVQDARDKLEKKRQIIKEASEKFVESLEGKQ